MPDQTIFCIWAQIVLSRICHLQSDTQSVTSVEVLSDTSLAVKFCKNLDSASAVNVGNYAISSGAVTIRSAVLVNDGKTVRLQTSHIADGSYSLHFQIFAMQVL